MVYSCRTGQSARRPPAIPSCASSIPAANAKARELVHGRIARARLISAGRLISPRRGGWQLEAIAREHCAIRRSYAGGKAGGQRHHALRDFFLLGGGLGGNPLTAASSCTADNFLPHQRDQNCQRRADNEGSDRRARGN